MIELITDNEMIDHLDFEELSSLNKMIGKILIVRARYHIPTGMVMDHDYPNRQLVNCHAEGFSGFDIGHVRSTQSDQFDGGA